MFKNLNIPALEGSGQKLERTHLIKYVDIIRTYQQTRPQGSEVKHCSIQKADYLALNRARLNIEEKQNLLTEGGYFFSNKSKKKVAVFTEL